MTNPIDRAIPLDSPVDRSRRGSFPLDRSGQTSDTNRYRPPNAWDVARQGIKEGLSDNDRRNGRLGKRPKTQPVASVAINITRDENGNLSVDGALGANFGVIDVALIPGESLGVNVKIPTPAPGISGIAGVTVDPITGGLQAVTGGLGLGPIDVTVSISGCFIILSFAVPVPFKLPFKVGVGFGQKKIIPIPGCKLPPPPPRNPQSPGSHNTQDLGFPGLSPEEEGFLIKLLKKHPNCAVIANFTRFWNTVTYHPWEISWEESREIVENLGDGWLTRTFAGQGAGSVKEDSLIASITLFNGTLYANFSGAGGVNLKLKLAEYAEFSGINYYYNYSAKQYTYYFSGLSPSGYSSGYDDYAANPYRLRGVDLDCQGLIERIPYPRYSDDKIYNPPLKDLPSEPPTRLGNDEDDMGNCECACASLRLLREIHEVINPAQIKAFVAPVCPDPLDPEAPPVEPEVPPEPFAIVDYPSLFTYLLMQFCTIGESGLIKALGFPFIMPKHLNATPDGDDSAPVLGENAVEIKNLSDLYKNWIEIFDAIVGEFPVKMEITTDEGQTAPLEFTTIADALADIGALNVATAYDADNTFTLLIKVMLQVLKTNSLSHQTYDLMHLTNEQLGFRIKQKPFKQKLPIDPRFPDDWRLFNQDWEPDEDNCISFENDDKDTTKGILILMQEAIALIKSAHTMSGTPDQIVNRIKGLAQIVQLGRQLGLGETLADILSGNWQSTLESFQKPATAASPEIKVSDSEGQPPATP